MYIETDSTGTSEDGGIISLFPNCNTGNPGGFSISARDGNTNNSKRLVGKRDGTLTWNSNSVITSGDIHFEQKTSDTGSTTNTNLSTYTLPKGGTYYVRVEFRKFENSKITSTWVYSGQKSGGDTLGPGSDTPSSTGWSGYNVIYIKIK